MSETNHLRKIAKERMAANGKNPRGRSRTTQAEWCYAKDSMGWEHGAFTDAHCPKCVKEENEYGS